MVQNSRQVPNCAQWGFLNVHCRSPIRNARFLEEIIRPGLLLSTVAVYLLAGAHQSSFFVLLHHLRAIYVHMCSWAIMQSLQLVSGFCAIWPFS